MCTTTGHASVKVPADPPTQSGAGSDAKAIRGDVTECFATTAIWAERITAGSVRTQIALGHDELNHRANSHVEVVDSRTRTNVPAMRPAASVRSCSERQTPTAPSC